ncbi:MAG: hypothetical protein HXY30_09055 [Pseudorhodoplanes sp.]|nr:hypothetical protein [Pseudorhodoplanes sp.]
MTSAISSRIALCAAAAWLILPAAAHAQAWPNQGGQSMGQFPSGQPAQAAPAASSGGWPSSAAPASGGGGWPSSGPSAPIQGGGGFAAAPQPGMARPSPGQMKCAQEVPALRDDVQSKGNAIKAVTERKGTREETCGAFKNFVAAESKYFKYLQDNKDACGVPDEAIKVMKANLSQHTTLRNRICNAAGGAPRAPSLSDALGTSRLPGMSNAPTASKGTTFDTLTGNPLTR